MAIDATLCRQAGDRLQCERQALRVYAIAEIVVASFTTSNTILTVFFRGGRCNANTGQATE